MEYYSATERNEVLIMLQCRWISKICYMEDTRHKRSHMIWLHLYELSRIGVCVLSHVWLFVTPWTVAHQALRSMGLSRQVYWSGLKILLQGSSWPRDRPASPALQESSLPLHHLGSPRKGKFIETESRLGVATGCGEGINAYSMQDFIVMKVFWN